MSEKAQELLREYMIAAMQVGSDSVYDEGERYERAKTALMDYIADLERRSR